MKIAFYSKYTNLTQDLMYYWNIYEIDTLTDFDSKFDVLMVDVDRYESDLFPDKIVWGICTEINGDEHNRFNDLILVPFYLPYIMFKLNRLNKIIENNQIN